MAKTPLFRKKADVVKTQTKILGQNAVNSTEPDLQFSNLVIGKKYRLSGKVYASTTSAGGYCRLNFYNDAGTSNAIINWEIAASAGTVVNGSGFHVVFVATSTSINCVSDISNGIITGDGTHRFTQATLEEVSALHETTTDFT